MIGLLIWLVVMLVVFYIIRLVIAELGLPPTIVQIVYLVLGLVFLLLLLGELGVMGGPVFAPLVR
jgi:hypothetical protein